MYDLVEPEWAEAFERWRAWARHTYRRWTGKREETEDEAWLRRWNGLADRVREQFR